MESSYQPKQLFKKVVIAHIWLSHNDITHPSESKTTGEEIHEIISQIHTKARWQISTYLIYI